MDYTIEVSIAHNGVEGLNHITSCLMNGQGMPQLIVLDINMPVMDGFEFLEEFQKLNIPEKVFIVMLTTSSHIKDMDKLFQSGNSDILAKPLTEKKLNAIIEKYFDRRTYRKTAC